jgi:prolyl-tRNA editing enzyme YbaK/EbsC (Cys-tRNA(Pro) deacylase)
MNSCQQEILGLSTLESMKPLSASSQKVQDVLDTFKLEHRVFELEVSVKTAQQAADVVGCKVAQIAKSLIFTSESGKPVLVIASGSNRVSETKLTSIIGESISRATPDFVRSSTGFAIGGIPPVGHAVQPLVVIDQDLLELDSIWAAAGHPNSLFELNPAHLEQMTGGTVANIREE